MRGGLVLVVAGVLLAGCAQKASVVPVASDGGASVTTPPPLEVVTPAPTPTGPTYVPPNGACTVRVQASPPVTTTAAPPSTRVQGDMPPNHVDNRSWRQRRPLSPENHARGLEIVERIRPVVAELCDAGNFSPDATKTALSTAGVPDAVVSGLKVSFGQVPPAGVYFYETATDPTLGTVCVLGTLRPGEAGQAGWVSFSVDGTIREGGCDEPFSH